MKQALDYLAQADRHLETISVRGTDVYAMVNARSALRAAYEAIKKEAEKDADE